MSARGTFLLGLALCGLAPRASAHGDEALVVLRTALDKGLALGDEEVTLERLAALGPAYVEPIFDVLHGDASLCAPGTPWEPLAEGARGLLLRTLARWPVEDVQVRLLSRLGDDSALQEELTALEVLAAIGDARSVEALERVLALVQPDAQGHPLVADAVEAALRSMAARDADVLRALERYTDRIPAVLAPAVVRALLPSGDWRALALAERGLERSEREAVEILDALGTLELRVRARVGREAMRLVRERLRHPSAAVRRHAAVAAGRLGDGRACDALLALARDDEAAAVRRAAFWALREISGLAWGDDADLWASWHARERTWSSDELPGLLERLRSADLPAAVDALRRLGHHPLQRHELVEELAREVHAAAPERAVAVCRALSNTRSPLAVEPLISALEDGRSEVREAAFVGLRALTGEWLSSSAEDWRAWLSG